MGNCTSDNPQGRELDNTLTKQLQADRANDRLSKKLLLLGPGNSGKSTFFKQLKKIHGQSYLEKETIDGQKNIYDCVISQMKAILTLAQDLKYELSVESQKSKEFIKELPSGIEINLEIASHIEVLWNDSMIKNAYNNRNNLSVVDSAAYFFDNIKRIGRRDYRPTEEDLLLVRTPTTGVTEAKFIIQNYLFRVFDVGGQRSERSKWIHCFDCVTAILYVAALSCYDQSLYEDENVNAMEETLVLFNEICNSRWFKSTAIILFLNKNDLFMERLEKVPLNKCPYFKDYKGNSYKEAIQYVKEVFYSCSDLPSAEKRIYTHVTTATDQENVTTVFNNVQTIIINQSLARSGLL